MIKYKKISQPEIEENLCPVLITDETIEYRKERVLEKMKDEDVDALVIYADLEHSGNFEYLCGFVPRFEEALLVLHQSGKAYVVLGNENLNKASKARISVTAVHMPQLSLPNQPMFEGKSATEILSVCELSTSKTIGLVGWKNFVGGMEEGSKLFDMPYFLVSAIQELSPNATLVNKTSIFIGKGGVRQVNNANEIAHYEFGAALSGNCILNAMNKMEAGMSELEVASELGAFGQYHNVVTIMSSGKRFVKANIYPTCKSIKLGDPISMTTSFKGGLQSRGGYAVSKSEELDAFSEDYLERLAKPYYNAVTEWVSTIQIGMQGGQLYDHIETIFPKKDYGWYLNPGHLSSDEEWMASPIYSDSNEIIKSGMIFQVDIIPSVDGFAGASCESGVCIADKSLRQELEKGYPEVWRRITKRQAYMREVLGINLPEHVLPTSNATLFYRPYLLNKEMALTVEGGR
ncbi:M24 family metallopeptidase [Erysipelothrix anatis]|uniref:M24 family metallopeptidase n=1 Tax=Erysipelothrix anatis TaxID=2683713 RepID=UPI00135CCF1F|nr:aminopeptidase P family protein [Erysipelothrix anatis]